MNSLYKKLQEIQDKFFIIKRAAELRSFDNMDIYASLCEIAEFHEIKCFTLILEVEGKFKNNNIEEMSEVILDFYGLFNTKEEILEQAKETANCYYFLYLKCKMAEMNKIDYVKLHHTYPYLIDPIGAQSQQLVSSKINKVD